MEELMKNLIGKVAEEIKTEVMARIDSMLEERKRKDDTARVAYGEKELSKYLGCNQSTISIWLKNGKFDGCYRRIGKSLYFDLNLIDDKFRR